MLLLKNFITFAYVLQYCRRSSGRAFIIYEDLALLEGSKTIHFIHLRSALLSPITLLSSQSSHTSRP